MHYFPLKRRRSDILLLIAGIVSLGVYFLLTPYWPIPSFVATPASSNYHTVDSLIREIGVSKDSVRVVPRPNYNEELVSGLVDTLGTFKAKEYFESHHLPYITRVYSIQKNIDEEVNFRITTGQSITKKNRNPLRQHYAKIELALDGSVEALEKRVQFDISLLQQDTSRLLTVLLAFLPPTYQTGTLLWAPETTEHGFSFVATVERHPYHIEKIHLTALIPDVQDSRYVLIGWEKEYVAIAKSVRPENQYSAFRGGVAVVVVLVLIGFIGVFIMQLRKKAVSIIFTLMVSVALTIYFVSVSLSFSGGLSLTAILLITISTFIFIGFLLGGMPLGGVVSLALEQFPEKFYTLRRISDSPWKSHFTGRSIVLGIALTLITECVFPVLYWLCSALGYDSSLKATIFNGSFFSLLQNPIILLSAALFFVPIVSLAISLIPSAISYRFLSPKRRIWGVLLGSMVCFGLLSGVQTEPSLPMLMYGCVLGISYVVLFYYTDVLGISVLALLQGILFFLPLSVEFAWIQVLFFMIIGVLIVPGIIGYLHSPEKVHEQDYKPEYLYKIEEEKRLRDELNAAQVVQRKLLPSKMPVYPQLDVAATCIPAFEVGGDYYDFFPLDESHLGILIGDVSGKGMSAAFYITLAKGVIVSQIQQSLSPADVLCKVNKLLYDTMERGKFISLIYGVCNTQTMEFTYAQAGHNPILHRKADGQTSPLVARGLALGLDSGLVFNQATTNHSVQLDAGDALILYTDGVTEAVNLSGEEFELDRLIQSANKNSSDSLAVLQTIVRDVESFIGKAKQHDDITLVVLKNNAQQPLPHLLA